MSISDQVTINITKDRLIIDRHSTRELLLDFDKSFLPN